EDGIRDTSVTGVQTCALPLAKAAAARPNPAPTPQAAPDPAIVALEQQIKDAKQAMINAASSKWGKSYWDDDRKKRPKNFGKIFWDWFGPASLTKDDKKLIHREKSESTTLLRHPKLDESSELEDVFGRFPVIQ